MDCDLAVIGVGGVGSAALLAAARRGLKVVGLEQFGAAHNLGSSHGQTRIIRAAYYEHPDYVPLALRAFSRWREIEAAAGQQLLFPCGLLQIGLPDSEVIVGVEASARTHDLQVDRLSPSEVESRWPWWRVPRSHLGLFEPAAGFLRVELCVASMLKCALAAGANLRVHTAVKNWGVLDDGRIEIAVGDERIVADKVVVSCGPWSGQWWPAGLPRLQILRKQQNWFHVDTAAVHVANGGVCWLVDEGPSGCFYGLPAIDRLGLKIAEHSGGQLVTEPAQLDRECDAGDIARATGFLQRWFRFGKAQLSHTSVCMYTMSPDQHFVVDRWPGLPQVVVAAGLSGHGFKFAPVLGEELIALAMGEEAGESRFLGLQRFETARHG